MKQSKEIVDQRRKRIMQEIQKDGSVTVDNLADLLNVTPMTIRRDLQYWEDLGAIERFYGGARLIQNFVELGENNNEPYKHAIAKYAASLVEEGDTIFINTSSTALLVLKYIHNKHVTVFTNNAKAIFMECDPNVQIILTGGELRFPKESMVGDITLNCLERVKANKTFLGCSGFDLETGMSTAILSEVCINQMMIERCEGNVFILADATKINKIHKFYVAKTSAFTNVITDSRISDEIMYEFEDKGINIKKLEPCFIY